MTPESVTAITAATAITRDLTVVSVLVLVIGGWLRGVLMRNKDHEKALNDLKESHANALTDLKDHHGKTIVAMMAAHAETLVQVRAGYEALLLQVRGELAAAAKREDEWKAVALEQRHAVREAVSVATNTGRGGGHD